MSVESGYLNIPTATNVIFLCASQNFRSAICHLFDDYLQRILQKKHPSSKISIYSRDNKENQLLTLYWRGRSKKQILRLYNPTKSNPPLQCHCSPARFLPSIVHLHHIWLRIRTSGSHSSNSGQLREVWSHNWRSLEWTPASHNSAKPQKNDT